MKVITTRRYVVLALRLSMLVMSIFAFFPTQAEGVKQVAPNSTDMVMLLIDQSDYGRFAGYNGPENSRLYVQFDNPNEVLYIGLSREYTGSGQPQGTGNYNFRIRRVSDDATVHGPFSVNSFSENLSSWQDAVAGPDAINAGGYATDDDRYHFAPGASGLYYIEFNSVKNIGFWDFTVGLNGVEKPGRVYSQNWAFRTPVSQNAQPECVWDRDFNGALYSYTADGFVTRIDFQNSGFQGLSFNVAFNSTGPGNSGDLQLDRMSVAGANLTDNAAEHLIFLTEPDVNLFPDGECGTVNIAEFMRCDDDGYCLEASVTLPGQVEIVLDFNSDGFYDPNVDQRLVHLFGDGASLSTCLFWDGLQADGQPVSSTATINLMVLYTQGIQHWALYDAEFLKNGFCIETVRPACALSSDPSELYWDDRNIPEAPGTTQPKDGRAGCVCLEDICRSWTNFQGNQTNCNNIDDDLTEGYGDKNTLNTWWFATDSQIATISIPLVGATIGGPSQICVGEEATLALNWQINADIISIVWTDDANTVLASGGAELTSITVSTGGIYHIRVTDEFGCVTEASFVVQAAVCPADLELDKSVNDTEPNIGQVLNFTVAVTNQGSGVGYGIQVTDNLPNSLESITNVSNGGIWQNGTIVWNNLNIPTGETLYLTYQATFGLGTEFTNYAEVTASIPTDPDSTPGNGVDTDGDGDCSDDAGDEDDGDCVTLEPQPCDISLVVSDPICSGNSTPINPDDDTFTFTVIVNGDNTSGGWTASDASGSSGVYGQIYTFGPYNISDGDISFDIMDEFFGDCAASVSVSAPEPCSDMCQLEVSLHEVRCDNNGTPSIASDDQFYVRLTVGGYNLGSGWINTQGISGSYDQEIELGPFAISDGPINLIFQDLEDSACMIALPVNPPPSCSNQCEIISTGIGNIQCNNNGTPTDPTDDTFTFEVTVTGYNTAVTWVADNGTTGVYGQAITFGPYLISDGAVPVAITDSNNGSCTTSATVEPPLSCSNECAFDVFVSDMVCDDGGTNYNPDDDTYSFKLNITAINNTASGWTASNGMSGSYGEVIDFGPLDFSEGAMTIVITDAADESCSQTVTIDPPATCSSVCRVIESGISNVVCNDNGTPTDPSDDTFTFDIIIDGFNTAETWIATDGTVGQYGQNYTFGPFPIANGEVDMEFWDAADANCFRPVVVTPPMTCSNQCLIELTVLSVDCHDAGTNYDPSDDEFTYTIRVEGLNNAEIGWMNDEGETGFYGQEYTFGPFPIADGPVEFAVNDLLEGSCTVYRSIAPPTACSETCFIFAEVIGVDCDENNTQYFTADDQLYYTVRVEGFNNTGSWVGNDGSAGVYGEETLSLPVALQTENLTIEINDGQVPGCATSITVEMPEYDIYCPANATTRSVEANIQILSGELANGDEEWSDVDSLCWLPAAYFQPGDHYYDMLRFRLPETAEAFELYTFYLFSDIPSMDSSPMMDGAGALFVGDYYENDPCCFLQSYPERRPTITDDFMENPTFNTENLPVNGMTVVRKFTMLLEANRVYNMATTSWSAQAQGNYAWVVIGQAADPIQIMGTMDFGIFIKDVPVQYRLFQNDAAAFMDQEGSLAELGAPSFSSWCGIDSLSFADQVVDLDDCEDVVLERTFMVHSLSGVDTCRQQIELARPSLGDIVMPPHTFIYDCNDDAPDLSQGFPNPSETGMPFYLTVSGLEVLNIGINANLIVTYKDEISINHGDSWQMERAWTIIDRCQLDTVGQFLQQIKAGLGGSVSLECPISNHYCPIIEEEIMLFNTDPLICTATIEAPMPVVDGECFTGDDLIITTEVVQEINGNLVVLQTIGPDDPRTVTDLELGDYFFRYTATSSSTEDAMIMCRFRIADLQEPVAICRGGLNLSLSNTGNNRVYAWQIDQGSHDNCAVDSMQLRRLYSFDPVTCDTLDEPYWSDWSDYVDFSCCDAGQYVTVEFRVKDESENVNFCWLNVLVEDKNLPVCTGLVNQNLFCEELPEGFDLMDSTFLANYFGLPDVLDNCIAEVFELEPIVNVTDCGSTGSVVRRFIAVDQVGNQSQDIFTQTITVSGGGTDYGVFFPADADSDCMDNNDRLRIIRPGCDLIAVTYEDDIMDVTGDECYNVARTWSVINFCEYIEGSPSVEIGRDENCNGIEGEEGVWLLRQPTASFIDRDSLPQNNMPIAGTKGTACDGNSNPTGYWRSVSSTGSWRYVQMLRVFDNTPPEVSVPTPEPFPTDNGECAGLVSIDFKVLDACLSEDVTISIAYDEDNDIFIDGDLTTEVLTGTYPDYNIAGDFPIGEHRFVIAATDNCGNTIVQEVLFSVVDTYIPEPHCYSGLIKNLTVVPPGTDVDGDGVADAGSTTVFANQLAECGEEDCSGLLMFSVNRIGEMADPQATEIVLTCKDRYQVDLEVWVWDNANNPYSVQPDGTLGGPNYNMCMARVYIQDPNDICPSCTDDLRVDGGIQGLNGTAVQEVTIELLGSMPQSSQSLENGSYGFGNLLPGGDYEIRPTKDGDDRQGITTQDLITLHHHLLQLDVITNPYLLLAADVNASGSVTTQDLIMIHQMIKGDIQEWPSQDSWKFVVSAYEFVNPLAPWNENYPTTVIRESVYSCLDEDFVGIKIGDINRSWSPEHYLGDGIVPRSPWLLHTPDVEMIAGEYYRIPIFAPTRNDLTGFQFSLRMDPAYLDLVSVEEGIVGAASLGERLRSEGLLTVSHTTRHNTSSDMRQPLFTLLVRARYDGFLREHLELGSHYTAAEAYSEDGATYLPQLGFSEAQRVEEMVVLEQNTPNPFRNETIIRFQLPEDAQVTLTIRDLMGKLMQTENGNYTAGRHQIRLSANQWPAGIYIYSIQVGEELLTRRMLVD